MKRLEDGDDGGRDNVAGPLILKEPGVGCVAGQEGDEEGDEEEDEDEEDEEEEEEDRGRVTVKVTAGAVKVRQKSWTVRNDGKWRRPEESLRRTTRRLALAGV
jgi:hypothetical protein